MNDDLRKIIEATIFAPSGENCQPWKFIIRGNSIELHNLPERDQSLYSWGQRASYMANGAALQNFSIACSEFGYKPDIQFFPDNENQNLIAKIEIIKSDVKKDPLYKYIPERCTNRKAYDTRPLPEDLLSELINSGKQGKAKLLFTQNPDDKKTLGLAGSTNEVVMFSNKFLHQFFFTHVNWTKEEDDQKKIGFFIDTLELPPPAKIGMKVFKNWGITNILNKIGLNKMIGKQNGDTNAKSSGFGLLVLEDNSPKSFVLAGMEMEKIWLTATKLGLSMQPLTGVLFFMYKIKANETDKFSENQITQIKTAYNNIAKIFGVKNNETIAFMFRFGFGEKPTARSVRFPIESVVEIK